MPTNSSGYWLPAAFAAALATGPCALANEVTNPGFETVEPIGGGTGGTVASNVYGDWFGDWSQQIVTAQDGITPLEGARMLHLVSTGSGPGASMASGADAAQLIDISALATEVAEGRVVATATGHFNRVAGDAQTDTEFRFILRSFTGDVSNYPANVGNFTMNRVALLDSDGDVATWEAATTSLRLPPGTGYLALVMSASENVFNDTSPPELDGHYADDFTLTFEVLCPGDADGNGVVDVNDITFIIPLLGDPGPDGDVDGNGVVDVNDITFVIPRLGAPCP